MVAWLTGAALIIVFVWSAWMLSPTSGNVYYADAASIDIVIMDGDRSKVVGSGGDIVRTWHGDVRTQLMRSLGFVEGSDDHLRIGSRLMRFEPTPAEFVRLSRGESVAVASVPQAIGPVSALSRDKLQVKVISNVPVSVSLSYRLSDGSFHLLSRRELRPGWHIVDWDLGGSERCPRLQ